jgi:tRNA pseudouridine55 synthase
MIMPVAKTEKKTINGILLLNKSQGITSNTALQQVKRLFQAKKAGHTGSLDPLATGMLPICFGEATKICQYLLDADKCYQTTGLLGLKTNTADSTGEVIARVDNVLVTLLQLKAVLARYTGAIQQTPSMFSALKYNGTPLYRFARAGIEIERAARDIVVKSLELSNFNDKEFTLTVVCSKGTYIRNLVEDIGDDLKVGAHVTMLHRVYTAGFEKMPMYTFEQLQEMSSIEQMNCLIPMDKAVDYLTPVSLSEAEALTIREGRILVGTIINDVVECVRLYDEHKQFIGLGERLINGDLKAKRLLSF